MVDDERFKSVMLTGRWVGVLMSMLFETVVTANGITITAVDAVMGWAGVGPACQGAMGVELPSLSDCLPTVCRGEMWPLALH